MGEEVDLDKSQSSDSFSLKSTSFFHQATKLHGPHQESSETSKSPAGVSQAFAAHTDYDKLCLSLLCGLPNEQELALNVCTILSNEGNYMLHLEQTPKLLELLVAQTGIFPKDDESLKMLYLESWNKLKGRNMYRFWRSTLDLENTELISLLELDIGDYDPHCKLLNMETDLGAHNVEGQRVLRIALILHNLSFEKNNVPVLISNRNFMRFMLLCIHSNWANLKQVAYDTLSNLACAIKLSVEKDVCSRLIFRNVVDGILSHDRYMNIRSMDILSQLCSHEANEDVIPSRLDVEVYQQMVAFLTVRDIMLLFYTLEALYSLSDLGRYACDKIVSVHRCIGVLVSLLTLEPTEYGPSSQINMKVVKTLVPADADGEKDCTGTVVDEAPLSEAGVTTTTTITSTTATNIIEPLDSEGFAINWLKSTYETLPGCSVSRNDIYSDYLTTCTKTGRKDIVNANVFAEYVKKAFPTCGVKKFESRGIITFHHDGLQKKGLGSKIATPVSKPTINTPVPKVSTPSAPVTCKPPQKTNFNSILKSQLSSAPKIVSTPLKNPTQVLQNQKVHPSPQPPPPQRTIAPSTPTNTGSSTLIKSLLASKVQQRNLQQQVVPSNVSKMVIYSPGGSGIIGSHTVVRCIRPGALHAVNIGTQIRSPLQTCLMSNNGAARIITNATPRFVKNTAVIRHALQPQVIKQGIVSTSSPRINGLQKDIQVVEEDCKAATIVSAPQLTQVVQVNTQQSHVLQSSASSPHSTLPNGENLQLIRTINTNNDLKANTLPVIHNSELQKLIGTKDLSQSETPVLVNSKSLSEGNCSKEPNQSNIIYETKKDPPTNVSLEQSAVQPQKTLSPTSILKSVLSDFDSQSEEIRKQQQQKDILRRAPLLNGLLDKGKLPLQSSVQSNTLVLNGNEPTTMEIVSPKENKTSQFVQLNQNSFVIPVSSLNSVISAPQSNLILMPVSSMNSIISSSQLSSGIPVISSSQLNSGISVISSSQLNSGIPVISSSQLNSGIPVISSSQLNSGIPVISSSQLNSGIPVISSSQLNSGVPVISSSQLNSGIPVISSSQLNSGVSVISSPSLNSNTLATSPVNSTGTFISSSTSTVQLSVPNPVIPSNTTFLSNGSNLMQLCIGQTTLSGTVEVQSDQQGVVRLHIESPENSNQGSDLSSISDIARTLECASKAFSKTNEECNTQVSFSAPCETTAPSVITTTVTTTSPSALTRTGQQFFVVTPTINQPQLQIQQPNFKFHILHSIPKIDESVDLISFPNSNVSQPNQLQQTSTDTSTISTTSLKRPSSDIPTQLNVPIAKKPCMDDKVLLSESLRTPTSVPCTLNSSSVSSKPLQDTKSLLLKSSQTENSETVSKLTTPKTVVKHVQKMEPANDKGNRTFSGLSSVNNNQPNISTSQVPQKSSKELEFLCEWKNCGLKFQNPSSVFLHVSKSHAPLSSNDLVCLWEGCDSIKRRRLSHLTHLQDWHCNESVLQNQAVRRKQLAQTGKSSIPPPQKPPPHPGYAPDAALLAIKRHALQYINPKELSEEKESVLTKSIRLTSALILRNLVTHSNLARTYLRRFEPDIAYLAMSPVESARTLAQCLSQLYTTHD